MPGDYVLYKRSEVVFFYRSLRSVDRELLKQFFDFLESYPHLKGETTEQDEIGRMVEVKFVGKFKVVFWADHAAKEVKILILESLRK